MRSSAKGAVARCSRSLARSASSAAIAASRSAEFQRHAGLSHRFRQESEGLRGLLHQRGQRRNQVGLQLRAHVERAVFGHRRQAPPDLVCFVDEGLESALVESRECEFAAGFVHCWVMPRRKSCNWRSSSRTCCSLSTPCRARRSPRGKELLRRREYSRVCSANRPARAPARSVRPHRRQRLLPASYKARAATPCARALLDRQRRGSTRR